MYTQVERLEAYGETTLTAAAGLQQTSRGLDRAADGLRNTGAALDDIPFVGRQLGDNVRRTARDVDAIAKTVQRTARQARATGRQTRDAARGVAFVLGGAVALGPTLPFALLYLLLRPLVAQQLRRR